MGPLDKIHSDILMAYKEIADLRHNESVFIEKIGSDLRAPLKRSEAMMILEILPADYSESVISELVDLCESAKHAARARALLARMPSPAIKETVSRFIFDKLSQDEPDDWTFRRMAELLEYLGYVDELKALVSLALSKQDAYVREVGEDYSHISNFSPHEQHDQ